MANLKEEMHAELLPSLIIGIATVLILKMEAL